MKHKGFTLIGLMIVVAIVTTAGSATADAYYKGEPWRSGDMGNATACYDMYGKRWEVGENSAPQWQQSTIAIAADIDCIGLYQCQPMPPIPLGVLNLMKLTFVEGEVQPFVCK
jgi:hypothetical protein|tara:strand:+ start:533 stop:871 length:339 start_codon:yes stop_codon:yes gene_type:complete